ncbi:MAG: uroporphyrinogen decarboxylase family protein [Prolixibacteraceae bacterium]|nr:uroporphyrinogen decarboxylase family protein [Prolixibacteraceae bacterium]
MTNEQWNLLRETVAGRIPSRPLTGFIIDSPWIPGWADVTTLQYYSSEEIWYRTNKKASEAFPDIIFIPGFWSEFGMCTETSAFGAKLIWKEHALPHAGKVLDNLDGAGKLKVPDPKSDGLLPFVIQRLVNYHDSILKAGHDIKFAVSRGPLNIASFLLGTTELMMGFMLDPENSHRLLEKITRFTVDWLQYQKEIFPSIEGILILDDIVGFIGEDECREYAVPYISRIFKAFDSDINFFHNDAQGLISSPFLKEMGVDMFNFSFEHSMKEIRDLTGPEITLVGNLPPRDVLAAGSPDKVREETARMVHEFGDCKRVIWSCGGGVPPDVSTENIRAFKETIDVEVPKLDKK